ncbi:MAG TPA: universal stress protein [Terriglobia bacterium]|nr:universal stress protein [Terriglobia bacterium]
MKFDHLLCPVDFSEPSASALRLAGALTTALHSDLHVLHAQRWELPPYFTVAQTRKLQGQLQKSEKAALKYLRAFVNEYLSEGTPRACLLVEDDPVSAILQSLRNLGSDLIVMGTHGRTGWNRIRLGSVLEGVLRQTPVPVLAVGPGAGRSGQQAGIHQVLCPVSFDNLSSTTIKVAASLAQATGARLTVLHVVEADSVPGTALQAAEKQLCDWVAAETKGQCSTREVVRMGNAVEAIIREAGKIQPDFVAIGASPKVSLGSRLFGTTTEALIRSAPCPVLVVPAPGPGTESISKERAAGKGSPS